jgi:hypothetical protein
LNATLTAGLVASADVVGCPAPSTPEPLDGIWTGGGFGGTLPNDAPPSDLVGGGERGDGFEAVRAATRPPYILEAGDGVVWASAALNSSSSSPSLLSSERTSYDKSSSESLPASGRAPAPGSLARMSCKESIPCVLRSENSPSSNQQPEATGQPTG